MQRTLALGAVWTASAAAAVGLGFLAVSLVDASASPGTTPAAASGATSTSAGATTSPTAPATSATGQHATVAGTVFANCGGGVPVLAGAPAAGWWVDDSAKPGEIEFENGTLKLEVHVVCANGGPQFSVEGPRPDTSGGRGNDDGGATSPASSSPAGETSGHDAGDDNSGRDGGGHGSDDSGSDNSGSGSDNSGSGSGSDD